MSPGGWPIDTVASTAVVTLCFVALNVAVSLVVRRRSGLARWLAQGLAAVLVVVPVAAGANAYFAYLPTVGSLLGRRATYQMSHSAILRLASGSRQVQDRRHGRLGRPSLGLIDAGADGLLPARAGGPAVGNPRPSVVIRPAARGAVDEIRIPGVLSGFHARPAQVYLPPAWFAAQRPALPVIMLLHGTPGEPADWTRGGLADVAAEAWADQHGGVAPIIVMPDPNGDRFTDSECVDGVPGRAETYLTTDVRNFVVTTYGADPDRRSWAVAGLSEGGTCAVRLALRHPEAFSLFLAFGADARMTPATAQRLFGRDLRDSRAIAEAYSPMHLLATHVPVAGLFCAGTSEGDDARAARDMHLAALASGMPAVLVTMPGGHHTFRVWRDCFSAGLPWAATQLQVGAASHEAASTLN